MTNLILDRTFFCELTDFNQPFATRFPDSQARLPKETYSSNDEVHVAIKQSPNPSDTSITDGGGFSCVAQAAWLLDQVFKTIEVSDINARLIQLDGFDHTLQTFLAIVMDQAEGRWGMFCTANAIIIRSVPST